MHRLFAAFTATLLLCVCAVAEQNASPDLVATAALATAPARTVTIRKQVDEVRVTFHAVDGHQRPVTDLSRESISILDNGVRVPAISAFHSTSDLPLSVALMVDASDSVGRNFAAEQQASSTLIRGLVRSNDDRLMLIAFREKIDFAHTMSADAQELASTMRQIKVGGLTALYDALVAASARLASTESSASRRAIILISDGDDTDSHFALADAIATAVRNDIAVYAITVRAKRTSAEGEKVLKQIADASGGRAYVVRGTGELSGAMQEIERDLRTQYFVTYRPVLTTGGFHTLKLTSTAKDVSIRARAGYFAAGR